MAWRVAESLEVLRKQLNEAFPKRSKVSDGSIGDEKHGARKSDHNPNAKGVVTARDFTHDPSVGIDCNWLAATLIANKDPRIKYVIWDKRICSSTESPWRWRPYRGINAHQHHLHVSVSSDPKLYDSKKEWELDLDLPEIADDVARVVSPAAKPEQVLSADVQTDGELLPVDPQPLDITTAPSSGSTTVNVSGSGNTNVKVDSSQPLAGNKERLAVVKAAPKKWYEAVWTKILTAITGSTVFQWLWGQLEKISGLEVPVYVWYTIAGLVAVGALLWIGDAIWDNHKEKQIQAQIDELLVKENSTADNLAQLIPANEIDLYRAKGFKIITRGEAKVTQNPVPPQ